MQLHNVLYIPELKYNLLSVFKLTDDEKHISFCEYKCFVYKGEKLLAVATKTGSLYHLGCVLSTLEQIDAILQRHESKENRWHRHFGHLEDRQLHELTRKS